MSQALNCASIYDFQGKPRVCSEGGGGGGGHVACLCSGQEFGGMLSSPPVDDVPVSPYACLCSRVLFMCFVTSQAWAVRPGSCCAAICRCTLLRPFSEGELRLDRSYPRGCSPHTAVVNDATLSRLAAAVTLLLFLLLALLLSSLSGRHRFSFSEWTRRT